MRDINFSMAYILPRIFFLNLHITLENDIITPSNIIKNGVFQYLITTSQATLETPTIIRKSSRKSSLSDFTESLLKR